MHTCVSAAEAVAGAAEVGLDVGVGVAVAASRRNSLPLFMQRQLCSGAFEPSNFRLFTAEFGIRNHVDLLTVF